jgi:hypothetical protein
MFGIVGSHKLTYYYKYNFFSFSADLWETVKFILKDLFILL